VDAKYYPLQKSINHLLALYHGKDLDQ